MVGLFFLIFLFFLFFCCFFIRLASMTFGSNISALFSLLEDKNRRSLFARSKDSCFLIQDSVCELLAASDLVEKRRIGQGNLGSNKSHRYAGRLLHRHGSILLQPLSSFDLFLPKSDAFVPLGCSIPLGCLIPRPRTRMGRA